MHPRDWERWVGMRQGLSLKYMESYMEMALPSPKMNAKSHLSLCSFQGVSIKQVLSPRLQKRKLRQIHCNDHLQHKHMTNLPRSPERISSPAHSTSGHKVWFDGQKQMAQVIQSYELRKREYKFWEQAAHATIYSNTIKVLKGVPSQRNCSCM